MSKVVEHVTDDGELLFYPRVVARLHKLLEQEVFDEASVIVGAVQDVKRF